MAAQHDHTRRLRSLSTIAAAVGATHRLQDMLELAAEEALRALGTAASLAISRWERERGVLRTLVNVGALGPGEERLPADEVYQLADYPRMAAVLESGTPYRTHVGDAAAPPSAVALLRRLGKESEAAVPIMLEGTTWGELWVTTAAGAPPMGTEDIEFLQAVAGHVATGIAQVEYLEQIAAFAFADPLTGLANRRALDERLEQTTGAGSAPVSLLMCDVNGLKNVNDLLGHAAGDRALVMVAAALRAAAGAVPGSLASRIGGDEFAVLLADQGLDVARGVAEEAMRLLDEAAAPVTLSCGAACSAQAGRDVATLFRAADAAQYEAKRSLARDVVLFDAESAGPAPVQRPGRRLRDRHHLDVGALLDSALQILDRSWEAVPIDRLERLARVAAAAVDADWWAVGRGDSAASDVPVVRASRALDDFPTVPVLPIGTGTSIARLLRAADPTLRPDEHELLRASEAEALLVGTTICDGQSYVLVLQAPGDAGDVRAAVPALRLLLAEAVPPVTTAAAALLLPEQGALG